MNKIFQIEEIGNIYNDYTEKFGIPRQSGLTEKVISKIIMKKEYCAREYFKGIENFSHIWLLWLFTENIDITPKATVRPPKLGGNTRVGVFASRSPFRPNKIAVSSVKIEKIEYNSTYGTVIYVSGADIMNGTPIIDIKPYLPYTDCHPEASDGFALNEKEGTLKINCPKELSDEIPFEILSGLYETLKQDPRPSYQDDSNRIYGMSYNKYQIKFKVENNILTITDIK